MAITERLITKNKDRKFNKAKLIQIFRHHDPALKGGHQSVLENSKEGYYLALRQTQGTLKTESPNWQPWILFFQKALNEQKQKLEIKLEREKLLLGQKPELSLKIPELVLLPKLEV